VRYGQIGRPVMMFEAFKDYRDNLLERGNDPNDALSLEEAHSKADFPSFLFGPISTSLYKGYTRVDPQYRRYGRVESVSDFRARRIRGLWGITGIGYVGDQGEYPEMRRRERPSASLVVDTYGGVYEVTRQAIINDDSGALLRDNPEEMGYSAAVFVTETIIAFIESNPTAPDGVATFQNVGAGQRGNQVSTALSEDALATAISFMENQLDDDGRRIVVRPRTLAVKNVRLELIANRIIRSQQTGTQQTIAAAAGAASDIFDKGTDNPLAGILPGDAVVRDPYWSDANDWYLFADPADVPAFAVGFLNGQEAPSVFIKNQEARSALGGGGQDPYTWEVDSVDFKVRLDFGVGVVDPKAVYRATVT
jgi:hypothetical protein